MKIKYNSQYIIYCILVILIIYQDSPLYEYFGAEGYSLLPTISCIGIALYMISHKKILLDVTIKKLIRLGVWLIVISVISISIWVMLGNSIILYQEFLPIKTIKILLQYTAYLSYVVIMLMYMRKLSIDQIFRPIVITLVLMTIICVIEANEIPYAFRSLHYIGEFPYYRIRLITQEASYTTTLIYIFVALSLFYSLIRKKTIVAIITIVCAVVLISNTGARSAIVAVVITVLVYSFLTMRELNGKNFMLILIVLIGGGIIVVNMWPWVQEAFKNDIEQYTSFATRTYTVFVGLVIGLVFPVGIGGAYLGVFPDFMMRYIDIFYLFETRFNLWEIYRYVHGTTDNGLAVKAGLMHYNMLWGVVGTFLFLRIMFKMYNSFSKCNLKYKTLLKTTFISNIIFLLMSDPFSYQFWLLVAIFLYFIGENEKDNNYGKSLELLVHT